MRHVYIRLGELLGQSGALYAYSDDVYMVYDPTNKSKALSAAPRIYKKVGIRIKWGPSKTDLILPPDCNP
jgi:hypothetical protein